MNDAPCLSSTEGSSRPNSRHSIALQQMTRGAISDQIGLHQFGGPQAGHGDQICRHHAGVTRRARGDRGAPFRLMSSDGTDGALWPRRSGASNSCSAISMSAMRASRMSCKSLPALRSAIGTSNHWIRGEIGPNSRNRSRPLAVEKKNHAAAVGLVGSLGDNAFLDELADLVGDELA